MTLPNAIIIGAQKCGTTSLYDWLGQHPEIYGNSLMKEYNFFAKDDLYQLGLDWFAKKFSDYKNQKIILHGYINYIYFSEISAKRISEFNSEANLILILRNPIDRAYSAFWEQKKNGREFCDTFEESIKLENSRKKGDFVQKASLTYIDHGFYSDQIEIFLKFFKKQNLKIILFDDLKENPKKIMKNLYNFLQVDADFCPDYKVKNSSGAPRIKSLQRLFQKLDLPVFIKKRIPFNLAGKLKTYLIRNLNVKSIKYPPMSLETRKKLSDIYKAEIYKLEKILHRDLSAWK